LQQNLDVIIVKHINYFGKAVNDNVQYQFFRGRNKFFHIPLNTLRYVRKEKPDLVIFQGAIFPFQLVLLKMFLNKRSTIIVQHHGNLPFTGIKKLVQQVADKFVDAYIFTALGNVKIWNDKKIIKSTAKCFEVLEGTTYLEQLNKKECRAMLQMGDGDIFLWVGRLAVEKDPITILLGFEKYLRYNPAAKLYMIYQEADLLSEVVTIINTSPQLKNAVQLVGKIEHEQLAVWFSAADFYISGSHREAAGYALLESLACGCIPVVTDIPPFRKIVGRYGFLFSPGEHDSLCDALVQSSKSSKKELSENIVNYFKEELSFKKIADDIYKVCQTLTAV
jgi:glycosyltransferase involved in cell wall biosynthesis